MIYTLKKENLHIQGEITLNGSKSIANRALILQALCEQDFSIHQLSNSKDTLTLQQLLQQNAVAPTAQEFSSIYDAGAAGTTFRFMTAYLALQQGTQILTGTERMKQRPIGVLVEALKKLGAKIEYLEKKGYPPLKIHAPQANKTHQLSIAAGTSSQYISALLMIAPTLPNGLKLSLEGKIVSRPYIEMTLNLMHYFGVEHQWRGNTISVAPQKYQAKDLTVEADWSAASYYYALAAFSDELDLQLNNLYPDSVQGDSVLASLMESFGVETTFNKKGIRLSSSNKPSRPIFECDFIRCPDIAQTLAVVCAGLGIQGLFTGLDTLSIKETDRIAALQTELGKVNVFLNKLPARFSKNSNKEYYLLEGKAYVEDEPTFATYEDHRMAMAFAPLAMLGTIKMEDPMVVVKSYPAFYEDLKKLGFVIS